MHSNGASFDAPCRYDVDQYGREILELDVAAQRATAEKAAQELVTAGVISATEVKQMVEESCQESMPYKGANTVLMMEWEKPYMEACVDSFGIEEDTSVVLEIGFGLGYSATRIQRYKPRRHVIVGASILIV